MLIFEVVCTWEPLVLKQELEKRGKYQEFAVDLASQLEGWRTIICPLVLGDLASLAGIMEELKTTTT